MTWKVAGVLSLFCVLPVCLQAETLTLDDAIQAVEESLPAELELDAEELRAACRNLQEQFQGEYVLDLAALHEVADALLPWLDRYEETQPYAAWLRARLDYFAIAEELRVVIPPPPSTSPWLPVPPINPSPELERAIWVRKLSRPPQPPAGRALVPKLKRVFAAQGVPSELVWLAEVESGFNPKAQSPVGAAGLFQLMPATAKWLELKLSPVDERLDPERSAHAAARYLRYLYGKFGDWRLTLAAYNAGESRLRRAMGKHNARTFDDVAVHLPAETQMYVPKLEATLLRREGIALVELSTPIGKR